MNDPSKDKLLQKILKSLGDFHFDLKKRSIFNDFDEDRYFEYVRTRMGYDGFIMARRLVELTKDSEEESPWDWLIARVTEWKSPIELKELFESESLDAMYGTFIDQRYIDFLTANTEQLCNMNWRKFEALTAE